MMPPRSMALVAALSLLFFLITATTFASLGVLLPAMIAEFSWNWTTAGLGFTVLALATGIFSPVAASVLARFGASRLYAAGGAAMAAGFMLMASANGVLIYLVAAALIGAGFAFLANVAGTYLIGRAAPEKSRSLLIGAYLGAGGAGGVVGPMLASAGSDDWRGYWGLAALAVVIMTAIVVALTDDTARRGEAVSDTTEASEIDDSIWRPREALRTPAFAIIAFALTIAYFCGVTVSTWSVAHLQKLGLAPAVAVGMLSLYALANALSRAAGGVLVRFVSARTLLIAALLGNVVGMSALAYATTTQIAIAFALFDGFAFGMALFATTALVIDYFGLKNSPALLGALNLAATAAMLGPTIAGSTADRWGGFAPIFIVYAGAALIAALCILFMKKPARA